MDKYEQQETGNPKPSGNISYYKSLKEKEEINVHPVRGRK